MSRLWAIRTKYLERHTDFKKKSNSFYTYEKWHQHTTKWFENSNDAWDAKEQWELQMNKKHEILESASSLIHKEK